MKNKKINLCHIVKSFDVGGVESIVKNLSNGIVNNDFEVTIIALTSSDNTIASSLNNRVRFIDLGFSKSKFRKLRYSAKIIIKLKKTLSSVSPDIINSHLYFYDLLLLSLSNLFSINCIHVRTVHSSGGYYESPYKWSSRIRLFVEHLSSIINKTYFIGVSSKIFNNNNKLFSSSSLGSELIYNGIDLTKFKNEKKRSSSSDSIELFYVARLEQGKNHELVLRICPRLIENCPNIKVNFVGDGMLRENLIALTRNLNIENYVTFYGNRTDVNCLLSNADIAIFPSEYEGFSLVLLEKMASGIPVVASNIDAFNEVIVNGVNGYIARNDDEYVNYICSLYHDYKLRGKIGETSITTANKYSNQEMIDNYTDFYRDILE